MNAHAGWYAVVARLGALGCYVLTCQSPDVLHLVSSPVLHPPINPIVFPCGHGSQTTFTLHAAAMCLHPHTHSTVCHYCFLYLLFYISLSIRCTPAQLLLGAPRCSWIDNHNYFMIYPIMWKNHCKNSSILLGYSFFFTWVFLVYTTYVLIHGSWFGSSSLGCHLISWLAMYIQLMQLYMQFLIWLFFTLAAFQFHHWLYMYIQLIYLYMWFLIWLFFTLAAFQFHNWLHIYNLHGYTSWFGYSSLWLPFNFTIGCVHATYALMHVGLDLVILHFGCLSIPSLALHMQLICLYMWFLSLK